MKSVCRFVCLFCLLGLAGCTLATLPLEPVPASSPVPPGGHETTETRLRLDAITAVLPPGWRVAAAQAEQAELEHGAIQSNVLVDLLRFSSQDQTFLRTIEETAASAPPVERRYLVGPDGVPHGELLVYADRLIAFLQPQAGGAAQAIRVSGTNQEEVRLLMEGLAVTAAEPRTSSDVVIESVEAEQSGNGAWSFQVTLRHPDTGWEDYADGWQIATMEGEILGTRILLHPHVNEQPFTRSLGNVAMPVDVKEVQVVAHDLVSGYTPQPHVVSLPAGAETE